MEVSLINKDAIKIKGKRGAVVIDPSSDLKTAADAVILLQDSTSYSFPKIEGARVVIHGAGDYEISGIKISGFGNKDSLYYSLRIDQLSVLLTDSVSLKKSQENIEESQVVIVKANSQLEPSIITALSPVVVIVYGEKAAEVARTLGKESSKVSKYITTVEKLPVEMEVTVLE